MDERITVVWVCAFSNPEVRKHYKQRINPILKLLLNVMGHRPGLDNDYAIWDTNAIKEFEKYPEIDLHVICPIRYLSDRVVCFELNGVHYHFFRDQHSGLIPQLYYQLINKYSCRFKRNRECINMLIRTIHPRIVHIMGAENPYYSLSALDVSQESILIVQLQALLMRLVDITKNPKQKIDFAYKGRLESEIIERADYIGTTAKLFKDYLLEHYPQIQFLDLGLAMGPTINAESSRKEYDFVYFAANINKAGMEAVRAFALAYKAKPGITLDIIGQYDPVFKRELDVIIQENSLQGNVVFEGLLPTHDDVINQIRKSRFALLPLKMDMVPNTVIEAMSNGLVVVSTITHNGTSKLNEKRECVLLSEQGDFQSMAENMVTLINDAEYASLLRNNSFVSIQERHSNQALMKHWRDSYLALVK